LVGVIEIVSKKINMKKIYLYVILLIIVQSCSNGDELNSRIIGKWQVIERYESGILVENGCTQYYYSEFKSNNEFVGGYIDFDNTPNECSENVAFELLFWTAESNNTYKVSSTLVDVRFSAYFEGNNLIIESSQVPYLEVLKRLE